MELDQWMVVNVVEFKSGVVRKWDKREEQKKKKLFVKPKLREEQENGRWGLVSHQPVDLEMK